METSDDDEDEIVEPRPRKTLSRQDAFTDVDAMLREAMRTMIADPVLRERWTGMMWRRRDIYEVAVESNRKGDLKMIRRFANSVFGPIQKSGASGGKAGSDPEKAGGDRGAAAVKATDGDAE